MCDFLNETVNPVEQANALQISVDLYERIVLIRRDNFHDFSIDGRVAVVVSVITRDLRLSNVFSNTIEMISSCNFIFQREICREFNRREGVFNLETPNVPKMSPKFKLKVSFLLNTVKRAENAAKIPKLVNLFPNFLSRNRQFFKSNRSL